MATTCGCAQPAVRREYPVIARQVHARRRHQGGEARHQVQWVEHDVCRAIAVRALQLVAHLPG
jgi:hypothetical protein